MVEQRVGPAGIYRRHFRHWLRQQGHRPVHVPVGPGGVSAGAPLVRDAAVWRREMYVRWLRQIPSAQDYKDFETDLLRHVQEAQHDYPAWHRWAVAHQLGPWYIHDHHDPSRRVVTLVSTATDPAALQRRVESYGVHATFPQLQEQQRRLRQQEEERRRQHPRPRQQQGEQQEQQDQERQRQQQQQQQERSVNPRRRPWQLVEMGWDRLRSRQTSQRPRTSQTQDWHRSGGNDTRTSVRPGGPLRTTSELTGLSRGPPGVGTAGKTASAIQGSLGRTLSRASSVGSVSSRSHDLPAPSRGPGSRQSGEPSRTGSPAPSEGEEHVSAARPHPLAKRSGGGNDSPHSEEHAPEPARGDQPTRHASTQQTLPLMAPQPRRPPPAVPATAQPDTLLHDLLADPGRTLERAMRRFLGLRRGETYEFGRHAAHWPARYDPLPAWRAFLDAHPQYRHPAHARRRVDREGFMAFLRTRRAALEQSPAAHPRQYAVLVRAQHFFGPLAALVRMAERGVPGWREEMTRWVSRREWRVIGESEDLLNPELQGLRQGMRRTREQQRRRERSPEPGPGRRLRKRSEGGGSGEQPRRPEAGRGGPAERHDEDNQRGNEPHGGPVGANQQHGETHHHGSAHQHPDNGPRGELARNLLEHPGPTFNHLMHSFLNARTDARGHELDAHARWAEFMSLHPLFRGWLSPAGVRRAFVLFLHQNGARYAAARGFFAQLAPLVRAAERDAPGWRAAMRHWAEQQQQHAVDAVPECEWQRREAEGAARVGRAVERARSTREARPRLPRDRGAGSPPGKPGQLMRRSPPPSQPPRASSALARRAAGTESHRPPNSGHSSSAPTPYGVHEPRWWPVFLEQPGPTYDRIIRRFASTGPGGVAFRQFQAVQPAQRGPVTRARFRAFLDARPRVRADALRRLADMVALAERDPGGFRATVARSGAAPTWVPRRGRRGGRAGELALAITTRPYREARRAATARPRRAESAPGPTPVGRERPAEEAERDAGREGGAPRRSGRGRGRQRDLNAMQTEPSGA